MSSRTKKRFLQDVIEYLCLTYAGTPSNSIQRDTLMRKWGALHIRCSERYGNWIPRFLDLCPTYLIKRFIDTNQHVFWMRADRFLHCPDWIKAEIFINGGKHAP